MALGLDFGAADVLFNARRNQAYVLEVNTAPGLEGQTVNDYAEAFKEMIRDAV
jgi:D-alanine-D-alanine ligase-like ATP-grasp enzyme